MISVIADKNVSLQAKAIYFAIQELAKTDTLVRTEAIAELTGANKYAVLRALNQLMEQGYIEKSYVKTTTTRGGSSVIYACTDK